MVKKIGQSVARKAEIFRGARKSPGAAQAVLDRDRKANRDVANPSPSSLSKSTRKTMKAGIAVGRTTAQARSALQNLRKAWAANRKKK
jgi:succinate dehydrogenase/fumarate reductase flavoprotein subunit